VRALVFDEGLRFTEAPIPEPGEGEALVHVRLAGVCNTDLEILRGYMGYRGIPGHEFVGIVEHSGNEHLLGKRVVGEINCACGSCCYCEMEMPHHCVDRTVLGISGRDGAFAEYLVLPEENLHLVPETVGDEVAVFTEPTAAAFRILEQVRVSEGDRAIVLGDGKLGQIVAQVLWLRTKQLVCIGKHEWKLELLRRHQVGTALIDDLEQIVIEPGADVVVEATGSPEGLEHALRLVRPEGTVVLKTTVSEDAALDLSAGVVNEVRIVGSRCGPFRPALEALGLGTVDVRPMITEVFPLNEGERALERAGESDVMKVLIRV